MKELLAILLLCAGATGLGQSGLDQFSEVDFLDSSIVEVQYSGQVEVLVIPQNTSFIRIDVHGARGGDYNPTYGTLRANGGMGARLEAVALRSSISSDTLLVNVGGQNGYNGGGEAGYGSSDGGFSGYAGSGGGMTSISVVVEGAQSPQAIAGGGGGAGRAFRNGSSSFSDACFTDGGDGGYEFGLDGDDGCASETNGGGFGGDGASSSQGGAGGEADADFSFCDNGGGIFGTNGEAFSGGNGGDGFFNAAGGGGGGGYFGGGGGASPCWGIGQGGGGGGGGSSFLHSNWELLGHGVASVYCNVWNMWPNGSCQDHGRATITFYGGYILEGCLDGLACNYNALATEDNGSCLYGCSGCSDSSAANFNPTATVDDGSCVYPLDYCGEGTVWDEDSQTCIIDETYCSWQPDSDGDQLIGVSDLLMFLSVFGDTDLDQDGIFDSNDDCVGEYDECGVCNGSGPSLPIIESIEILYDSLYAEQIDEWWVFEVGADTTYEYVCGLGCTDPLAENYDESVDTDDGSCVYPWACGDPLEFQGYDYETVQIGEQCWFAENLRSENYSNGEALITDVSGGAWANLAEGACIGRSDNDPEIYGLLYNWFATQDSRGLCPSGWNVPSDIDFSGLFDNYDTFEEAGGALKSKGSLEVGDGLWYEPNLGATNESGFSAIPSGQYICNPYAYSEGNCHFDQLGYFNYMWTRTETNLDIAKHTNIYSYAYMTQAFVNNDKRNGLAVRCIKDTE